MLGTPKSTKKSEQLFKGFAASPILLTAKITGDSYVNTQGLVSAIETRLNKGYDYNVIDNQRIVDWLQANERQIDHMNVDQLTKEYFEHVTESSLIGDDVPGSPIKIGDKLFELPPDTTPADIESKLSSLRNVDKIKQRLANIKQGVVPFNNQRSVLNVINQPQSTTITQAGPNKRGLTDVRQTFLRSPQAMAQASAMGLDLNNQADFETFLRMSQQPLGGPIDADERDQLTVYGVKRVKSKPPKKFNMRSATVY